MSEAVELGVLRLREALRWALEYIDAIPADTPLPAMPGFDRDYVNGLLASPPVLASLTGEGEPVACPDREAVPEGYKLVPVEALEEVRDLLAERRYGNPARSPGHNARLAVEALLSASGGGE